jgi:hypothetical protein
MNTRDRDIIFMMHQFFRPLKADLKPKFSELTTLVNTHSDEINGRMTGTKNYPCPDLDHLKGIIGDGNEAKIFIDWLMKRRIMHGLPESIRSRMDRGEPCYLGVMFNPSGRVDGGSDEVQQNLRNQIAVLSTQNTALNAQNAETAEKLQEERRTSGLQLLEITRLGRELESLKTDTEAAKVAAAVSDAKISDLEANKRSLQEKISRLEAENADLVKKSEKTDAQLKEQQENLDELGRRVEEMTIGKNDAKDVSRVDDDEHSAPDNDEHNGDEEESDDHGDEEESDDHGDEEESDDHEDEEESDDHEDEEESDGNEEGSASDGKEDREGKQDTLLLLGNTMQKIGNAAASVASGAVSFVTKGVARALTRASDTVLNANGSSHSPIFKKNRTKKPFRKTPPKVTSQPGGSGGVVNPKRFRDDAGHGKSKKSRLDGTDPKRSRSNDGGAGPSNGKKPRCT